MGKFKYILLGLIVLCAFIIRIYGVPHIPPSLSWDEVSIGYNAYSILKTGKDEHGKFLPIDTFKAYGDYKPPIAIYLTVPSIIIFGFNEFAIRFPSVLAGTITVLLTYFLVTSLFLTYKKKEYVGLLASTILCLSPWHIQLSRAAYEANIALCFIFLGTIFVLRTTVNNRYIYFCWIPFVLAFYTFNSSRYAGPLIALIFAIYQKDVFLREWKKTLFGILIAGIILAPIIPHVMSPEARLRFTEVNIFSDISLVQKSNSRIAQEGNTGIASVLHNRRWYYFRSFLTHYLDHFEPWYLFIRGDGNPKFSLQEVGEFYIFESVFLVLGLFWMMSQFPAQAWVLLLWLLVSIIPAATARETPHALRTLNSLPTWHIFISFAVLKIIDLWEGFKKKIIAISIIFVYTLGFTYFAHQYLMDYPKEFSGEWQWGYREAISYAQSHLSLYDKVVMTDSIGRPYMYTLFYTKYDPNRYLSEPKDAVTDAAGFYNVNSFGKYQFIRGVPTDWQSHILYIMDPGSMPKGAHLVDTVKQLNGNTALVLFDM